MSYFVKNCYYCLQYNHSQYFGLTMSPLEEYILLDKVMRPPSSVNLEELWD